MDCCSPGMHQLSACLSSKKAGDWCVPAGQAEGLAPFWEGPSPDMSVQHVELGGLVLPRGDKGSLLRRNAPARCSSIQSSTGSASRFGCIRLPLVLSEGCTGGQMVLPARRTRGLVLPWSATVRRSSVQKLAQGDWCCCQEILGDCCCPGVHQSAACSFRKGALGHWGCFQAGITGGLVLPWCAPVRRSSVH